MSNRPPARYQRGSCICEAHELRITQRCLVEDLGYDAMSTFADASSHPIVRAFENQRSGNPIGTKTVGPAAGERTLYRIGYGHNHRGATWYDPPKQAVWLCAYRLHRSGSPDDAFPYFQELTREGRIMPTVEDYQALFADRGRRFAETVHEDAQALLARARSSPGIEQIGVLGGEERTGVVVEVVETLEETYVAFSVARIDPSRLVLILAAFYPDMAFGDWALAASLPTRPLRTSEAEVCYRILRG